MSKRLRGLGPSGGKRFLIVLGCVALAAVSSAGVVQAGGQGGAGGSVRILGRFSIQPNEYAQLSFRFAPGNVQVARGERLRFNDNAQAKEPHTVTIVRQSAFPTNGQQIFNCKPCNRALKKHRKGGDVVEDDKNGERGLDGRGDSRFMKPGTTIGPRVTAPAGTTLYYLCAIHSWMQGSIDVQ